MESSAKSRQEIARKFGVSTRTLNRWLKKHKIKVSSGLITPKESQLIYQILGNPNRPGESVLEGAMDTTEYAPVPENHEKTETGNKGAST
ncbi:helix-turn-helix domain-containing protein [Lunatimonas salinarum]|uniref:helix-turn-helix domain-containing protein n=1 Tax=Lunatimonas salinarum TaxID=1774590 RepID=UPI001ADFC21A|nr:helix-turn-helix domain-containing protein [Lunatimonas salinarum]